MKLKISTLAKSAVCALLVLLAGCAGAPPVMRRVEIPIFTPCVKTAPKRPEFEFDKLLPSASDGEKVMALARDWPRARIYEAQLEAAVAGCIPSTPG